MFDGVLNMLLLKSKASVRCPKRTLNTAKYNVNVYDICFEIFQWYQLMFDCATCEPCAEPCQTGRGFCTNSGRLLVFDQMFAKSSILDLWQDSEFASKASYDFAEEAPSQMFERVLNLPLITSKSLQPLIIFTKLLAICLLNLSNIPVLRTFKST